MVFDFTTDQLLLALIDKPGIYAEIDPQILPGDHVELGFRVDRKLAPPNRRSEWMWFEVTGVEGRWPNAVYRAELCNRPLLLHPKDLRPGSPIEFRGGHIYDVVHDSLQRPAEERE